MGLFAEWQPRYAEHGVATFPFVIDEKGKKPAVKHYARIGLPYSGQLALDFPEAEAFAFAAGKRSKITAIDIDAPDEDLLREALRTFGDTPLIARTGSGGFHCYYRHNGEPRKTRFDPSLPMDMIGGGPLVATPSKGSTGQYELIRGSLADLDRLPFIRGNASQPEVQKAVRRELVQEGGRNRALMTYLRGQARYADDLAALIDKAQTYADDHLDRTGGHPFTDAEVEAVAKSVWEWTEKQIAAGTYFVGTGRHLQLSYDTLDRVMPLGADATMLFMHLQRRFGGLSSFYIANDMSKHMPNGEWPRKRFAKARQALVKAGLLREKRRASSYHGAAVFEWA